MIGKLNVTKHLATSASTRNATVIFICNGDKEGRGSEIPNFAVTSFLNGP